MKKKLLSIIKNQNFSKIFSKFSKNSKLINRYLEVNKFFLIFYDDKMVNLNFVKKYYFLESLNTTNQTNHKS